MKVVDSKVSSGEIYSEIDLELQGLPKKVQSDVKKRVGEYLIESTLDSISKRNSPISGASFKKSLSKEYAKYKAKNGLPPLANLEFEGDLLDSLRFKSGKDSKIRIGHFKSSEAPKADGHNNFSGDSKLPERRYLPKKDDQYKRNIISDVDDIIKQAYAESRPLSETRLSSISTRAELWDYLTIVYSGLDRPAIRQVVKRSPAILEMLKARGLLRLLDG